jgi:hypothetical protein
LALVLRESHFCLQAMPEISCKASLCRLWYLVSAPCSNRDGRLSKVVDPRLGTLVAPDDIASSHCVVLSFCGVLSCPRAVVMLWGIVLAL